MSRFGFLVTVELWGQRDGKIERIAPGLRIDLDKRVFIDRTDDARLNAHMVVAAEALTDYIIDHLRREERQGK